MPRGLQRRDSSFVRSIAVSRDGDKGPIASVLVGMAERLVDENPRIGLLAMDLDRARGWVYQLRPQLTQIDSVTTAELADAIRCAANPTC